MTFSFCAQQLCPVVLLKENTDQPREHNILENCTSWIWRKWEIGGKNIHEVLSLSPSFTTLHLFFLFFLFCFVFNWNIIALQRCVNFCCTTAWINYKYTYTRSLVSLPPMHPASQPSLCSALFDPGDCSTPGLPIHHWLPEFTQTHPSRSSQNTNLRFLVFFKETV